MTIQQQITEKLSKEFEPIHLEVINESKNHSKGKDSHFKIILVSEKFNNKSLIEKHQNIYKCLDNELKNGVHALTLTVKNPLEWQNNQITNDSPGCVGQRNKK